MIKPHIVKDKKAGEVISMIENAGFVIKYMHQEHLSLEDTKTFYEEHEGKPFYKDLCKIISDGPVVAMMLEKPGSTDVVAEFRKFIGATNPADATPGTVRAKYGKNIDYNAIHGSDSADSADLECEFFFGNEDEEEEEEEDE
jgi:nucleoside-diphosphate kinase